MAKKMHLLELIQDEDELTYVYQKRPIKVKNLNKIKIKKSSLKKKEKLLDFE